MLNIKYKPKGVSLPLITGLVALLMVSSAAVNEMIIRSIQSVQRIEASNMAYLAAEGGIEDALYELAPHFAGYQTKTTRTTAFQSNLRNEWDIVSRTGKQIWNNKIYKNQKVLVYLYGDDQSATVDPNAINSGPASGPDSIFTANDIKAINATNLEITFQIPNGPDLKNPQVIINENELIIDNDNDLWINDVNEDGVNNKDPSCINPEDGDCDGLIDEDSDVDPVIMWKLTDGAGKNLIPIKGCLEELIDPGSEICEKDFDKYGTPKDYYSVTLKWSSKGRNESGAPETVQDFIQRAFNANNHAKLHFEFLIVAPMEHVEGNKKYEIPYIDFEVSSNVTNLPNPYFTINSDGYYRDYKQSITATISPKTTVPLFDFTIIQQE